MAKLILKSPYIQCGGKDKPSGFMNYIATRDGVELLPTSGYLDYMGQRKGSHGLFSDESEIDLTQAKADIDNYTGRIWTHIISLKREDASRLGYDNATAWRNLLRSHRNEIADAMHIPPNNFRWFAAYHDEGEHPHVHMMAYSVNSDEGRLYQDGIQNIRSKLTNDIFQMEMLHLYEQKSQSRNELLQEAKQTLSRLCSSITAEDVATPKMQILLIDLSLELKNHKGKKAYGYLKKPAKKLVDEIVMEVSKADAVASCYDHWQEYQSQIEGYYHQKEYKRKSMWEEKAFQPLKNHIIKIVDAMDANMMDFSDDANLLHGKNYVAESKEEANFHFPEAMEQRHTPNITQAVCSLLHQLSKIFESSIPTPATHHRMDKKEFQRILEKRLAQGIKDMPDYNEEEQRVREQTMQMY